MSTTTLVVEIVIIGVQVSLWFGCLVLTFAWEWIAARNVAIEKDWINILLIVTFAIAYPLGIAVDRVADVFFRWWNDRTSQSKKKKSARMSKVSAVKRDLQRMVIYMTENRGSALIDYPRSRLRIARATTINGLVIGVSIAVLVIAQSSRLGIDSPTQWVVAVLAVIVGAVASYLSFYAAAEVQTTEDVRTELFVHLLPHKGKDGWLETLDLDALSAQIVKDVNSKPAGSNPTT